MTQPLNIYALLVLIAILSKSQVCCQNYDSYVFWSKKDFNGGTSGNKDTTNYGNINDGINACNAAGSGCVGVSYAQTSNVWTKSMITVPNTDNNNIGFYIKNIANYVTMLDQDLRPYNDLAGSGTIMSNTACAANCNANSQCLGFSINYAGGCYYRSSYSVSGNSGMVSYAQIQRRSGFVAWPQIDFDGGISPNKDISGLSSTTMGADCATACAANPACAGYNLAYDANPQPCWMKSITANPTVGRNAYVFYMRNIPGYTTMIGMEMHYGGNSGYSASTPALKCYGMCDADSTCTPLPPQATAICGTRTRQVLMQRTHPTRRLKSSRALRFRQIWTLQAGMGEMSTYRIWVPPIWGPIAHRLAWPTPVAWDL
jgi:PAN domain